MSKPFRFWARVASVALPVFLVTNRACDYVFRSLRPPMLRLEVPTRALLVPNAWMEADLVVSNGRPRRLPEGLTVTIRGVTAGLETEISPAVLNSTEPTDQQALPRLAPRETHRIPIRFRTLTPGKHEFLTIVSEGTQRAAQLHGISVPGIPLTIALGAAETVGSTEVVLPVAVRNGSAQSAPSVHLKVSWGRDGVVEHDIGELTADETRTVFLYAARGELPSWPISAEASCPASAGATLRTELQLTSLRDRTNTPPPSIASCTWIHANRDQLPTNGTFPPIPYPIAALLAGEAGIVDLSVTLAPSGKPLRIDGRGPLTQSILLRETSRWISTNWTWPAGYRSPVRLPRFHFQHSPLKIESD